MHASCTTLDTAASAEEAADSAEPNAPPEGFPDALAFAALTLVAINDAAPLRWAALATPAVELALLPQLPTVHAAAAAAAASADAAPRCDAFTRALAAAAERRSWASRSVSLAAAAAAVLQSRLACVSPSLRAAMDAASLPVVRWALAARGGGLSNALLHHIRVAAFLERVCRSRALPLGVAWPRKHRGEGEARGRGCEKGCESWEASCARAAAQAAEAEAGALVRARPRRSVTM